MQGLQAQQERWALSGQQFPHKEKLLGMEHHLLPKPAAFHLTCSAGSDGGKEGCPGHLYGYTGPVKT